MPLPAKYDMQIWVGNDFDIQFTAKSDATTAVSLSNTDLMFTAYTPLGPIRPPALQKTLTIISADQGMFALSLTPAETRTLKSNGATLYEIELRTGGKEQTILHGKILLLGGNNGDAS